MEHLNKGDYANGDPIEAVYFMISKTFLFRARTLLVDEDAGEICTLQTDIYPNMYRISNIVTNNSIVEGRKIIPIPRLKRKLRIQIKADEWTGGDVDEEIELPKRVWSGRNSGVMFKVLFVDPGNEYAPRGKPL